MMDTFTCDHCGAEFPIGKQTVFDEQALCPDCLDELTVICDRCGERIWSDDSEGDSNTTLCQNCYDEYYHRCADCGRLIRDDDTYYVDDDSDVPYCDNCIDQHRGGIQSYYYKPTPIFYGEGSRYLGVELEIDDGGERDSVAKALMSIGNRDAEHIYIKHDGSLNEGMEIVTHPMTLDYHKNQMPWHAVMEKALAEGYYSHQSETCGLHVHVNRDSLGESEWEQEETIARILFFVENHWNELLRFSRRTKRQLEKWAARYGRKDSPKEVLDSAKESCAGRYACVNLTNFSTIEFRIFRGTLKYNTLIATLELVEELCSVAISCSDGEMSELTWTEFVSHLSPQRCPELIQYLKERRLYVNEPLSAAEEV
ncbi:amidoligase family protein [Oscillibacter sp.]|uniref:amidoligase family protein n=1 Tax=Oscillibacter sp. TaxID=1945593 RepID=UPI0028AD32B9|nr:amidoligase family protein [Oscillibacter sp.]